MAETRVSEIRTSDIFEQRSKLKPQQTSLKEVTPSEDIFAKRAKIQAPVGEVSETPVERGFMSAFKEGSKGGVSGLISGYRPKPLPEDATWLEELGSMAGKFVSDYPAMIPGAEVGALGGGALGSIVPGIGTGIGGLLGAGAGAMALPTAIDKAYEEYYKYADKGGEGTFGDFLSSVGNVAKETGKQAALGGAVGMVSKALPVLSKVPGFDKLLQTNLGRKAAGTGMEYGALTLGQAALEGRSPTKQEAVNNALLLAGLKTSGAIGSKLRGATNIPEAVASMVRAHPATKTAAELWKKMPEPVKDVAERVKGLRQNTQQAMYFDMLKDHIGERNARIVESQFKWRNALEETEAKAGKFTPEQLEEMIYYRQKTGNPKKKGDTYEELKARLPEHAKDFVKSTVGPHLDETLKLWNEHPLTKKINPREALEGIYLPGLYKDEPGKVRKAHDEVSRQFKVSNPMTNPKKFLTYMDAMQARGLTPRYSNIVDLMRAYDNINIKILSNLEFLDQIKQREKEFAKTNTEGLKKLIVNSRNRKEYDRAKRSDYVPFDDVFLRNYVAGTKKGPFLGQEEPIRATTAAPALVHPDLAPSLAGIFRREPYKDPSVFWKAADALTNELKHIEVVGSLFHYGSLFQHTGGLLGAKKAFQSVAPWYTEFKADADALLKNKEVMKDAARSGLVVHRRVEQLGERETASGKALNYIASKLPAQVKDTRFGNWAAGKLERSFKHLFDIHHPRLKIKAWDDMTKKYMSENPGANEKQVKREIAKVVNNVYGGQNWETMRFMNDPANMTVFRRMIAFPDWTLSQIRAADVGLPGKPASIAQKEARKYWLQYGLFMGGFHGFLKWLYGGLEQTDKDNKSPTGIRFNPEKAFNSISPFQQDPKNWYKVQLPDISMKIAGKEFNPGRAQDGRRLNMQMMKSALELGGWAFHPFVEFFKKSNPLIRAAYKQIMDSSPTETGTFPVQATWEKGPARGKPWGGTEEWTLGRFASRAKELVSEFKPFSLGGIEREGVAPFIASGLGAGSISKGISLHDSQQYIKKYLEKKDTAGLNKLKRILKDNGYSDKQINSTISRINNQLKKPKPTR